MYDRDDLTVREASLYGHIPESPDPRPARTYCTTTKNGEKLVLEDTPTRWIQSDKYISLNDAR